MALTPTNLNGAHGVSRDGSARSSLSSSSSGSWDRSSAEAASTVTARMAELERVIAERLESAMTELRVSVAAPSRSDAERALAHALSLSDLRRGIADIARIARAGDSVPRYLVSSLFLVESYRFLVKDPDEDMHFVTGPELGSLRVLERMVDFDKAERTAVRVAGDLAATHRALIALEARGHRLTAWIHSHPGTSEWATRPSPTDFDHQRRLEQGRYPAVGAIFSRDGYVRFFSGGAPFRIEVFGTGVRRIDERVYHLHVA